MLGCADDEVHVAATQDKVQHPILPATLKCQGKKTAARRLTHDQRGTPLYWGLNLLEYVMSQLIQIHILA
jgi:hypothetical protein